MDTDVASRGSELWVNSEATSSKKLRRILNKIVCNPDLNNRYWEGCTAMSLKSTGFYSNKGGEREKRETSHTG